MTDSRTSSTGTHFFGWFMLLVGASVFLVRFQHAGGYAFPRGGNLLGGALALLIGFLLLRDWLGGPLGSAVRWIALGASPIVLFFALYATLAELEEVVVLKAVDREGRPADLRLWIVDRDGTPWVTMQGSKADTYALDGARLELLRNGTLQCVALTRHDDRPTVDAVHQDRGRKYFVQRLATAIGMFGQDAKPEVIALRLDPCPPG